MVIEDVIIHKYTKIYEAQAEQLIVLCQEEKYLLRILKSGKLKFGYIATVERKIVGLLMVWNSEIHPYCTYFRLLIDPFFSEQNIESTLFSKFKKENLPLQTSIWETAVNLKKYYESHGFKEIRRTYMPVLNIEGVMNHLESVKDNQIKTLKEVLLKSTLKIELLKFVKDSYEETHLDNPVAEKSIRDWENLMLDDVLVEGSFVHVNLTNQTIEAFSFLHKSDKPNTFELGWCGSKKYELLKGLLVKQIHYANECNVQYLLGEFDTTSPDAMFCLGVLPFQPCPTWITYHKTKEY